MSIDAVQAHFHAFLAALEDPDGGGAIFDAHHPDAVVLINFTPLPISTFGRDGFAMLHQQGWALHELGQGGRRRPAVGAPRLLEADTTDPTRLVAWWAAEELEDGQALTIATGYQRDGEAWKLDWLTLAEAVGAWSYDFGRAQMLADFTYALSSLNAVPRSWLDLAHYRLYGHEKPKLVTLPEARFSCGMSGVCCAIDHSISVDAAAQAFVDAVPWETIDPALKGHQLPVLPNGKLQVKASDALCPFLDEHRHCKIHKAFGRPVFSTCTLFPFRYTETPDGVLVTASPLCGSVRSNMGAPLSERTADLHARLAVIGRKNLRVEETFLLSRDQAVPWSVFSEVEAALMAVFERTDLPISRRLWLGVRLLEAAETRFPAVDEAWVHEPIPAPDAYQREQAEALLGTFHSYMSQGTAPAGPANEQGDISPGEWELGLRTSLRNLIASKTFSFGMGLRSALNLAIVLAVLAERMAEQSAPGAVSSARLTRLVMRLMNGPLARELASNDDPLAQVLDQPWLGKMLLAVSPEAEPAVV